MRDFRSGLKAVIRNAQDQKNMFKSPLPKQIAAFLAAQKPVGSEADPLFDITKRLTAAGNNSYQLREIVEEYLRMPKAMLPAPSSTETGATEPPMSWTTPEFEQIFPAPISTEKAPDQAYPEWKEGKEEIKEVLASYGKFEPIVLGHIRSWIRQAQQACTENGTDFATHPLFPLSDKLQGNFEALPLEEKNLIFQLPALAHTREILQNYLATNP